MFDKPNEGRYRAMMDFSRQAEIHAEVIAGAAEEVHRVLGPGFRGEVYREAMCDELSLRGVPYLRNAILQVQYKGRRVGEQSLDLLVGDHVVVDLFAVEELTPGHTAKMMTYLKSTRQLLLGMLINFNVSQLHYGIKTVRAA